MKNKSIYITIFLISIALIALISYSYYSNTVSLNSIINDIQNGSIEDDTLAMYVDGNEVQSMNAVPSGYIIDEENSFCFTTDKNNPDTNATLYTNSNGEHVIGNLSKGEKCVVYFRKVGPTSYWFGTTELIFPASGGSAEGHYVYIGQDSSKYYACATIQGHEVCLSQPYTQYGLSDHTLDSNFTSDQQTNVKNAILQVFNDAGINIDISSCYAGAYNACCYVGDMNCYVYRNGIVNCSDNDAHEGCDVGASGGASCSLSGDGGN